MQAIEVIPGLIYRGPQPVGSDWASLKALGIRTVVKLDYPDEGSDQGALDAGIIVGEFCMPPRDLIGAFGKPDTMDVDAAVTFLANPTWQPTYIHCLHGQDRTGLVVGEFRVLHQGWSTTRALIEMLKYGFHVELPDLMMTWLEFALEHEKAH